MSERKRSDFLSEVDDVDLLVAELSVPGAEPSAPLREAILATASHAGRFARFAEKTADFLDVSVEAALATLDFIDQPSCWQESKLPDVSLIDLEGGPAVQGAIRGFVRMPAGSAFPEHYHVGDEVVLVIQGGFQDSATHQVFRPGAVARMTRDTSHGFIVEPGPDLVYLVVVQRGIRIGAEFLGPDDPRI